MEVLSCDNCSRPIVGAAVHQRGKNYCSKCALSLQQIPTTSVGDEATASYAPVTQAAARSTMKFYFCETCGKRITEIDIESGAGKDKKLKGVYCKNCAVGVMTMDMEAITIPERPRTPPSNTLNLPAGAQASASNIDAAHSSAKDSKNTRSRVAPQAHTSVPRKTQDAPILMGAVLLIFAVVLMPFLMSGQHVDVAESKASSKKPAEPIPPARLVVPPETPKGQAAQPVQSPKPPQEPDPAPPVSPAPLPDETVTAEKGASQPQAIGSTPPSNSQPTPPVTTSPTPTQAPRADPIAVVDDVEPRINTPTPPVAPAPAAAPSPASGPASGLQPAPPAPDPEKEIAASREWVAIGKAADSRNFRTLQSALSAFKAKFGETRFATNKAEQIGLLSSYAADGLNLDNGLAGYWKFDEGSGAVAADSSGHGNTGRLGGKTRWAPGKVGNALAFNGKDDFVTIPNSPTLEHIQEGEYSIAAWVMPQDIPTGADTDNNGAYAVMIKPGFHEGLLYNHGGRFQVEHYLAGDKSARGTAEHNSAPGVYHHVAVTISAANGAACIYVDGVLDGSWKWTPGAQVRNFGKEPWNIGIGRPKGGNWAWQFKGIIDEVRLYDRILKPSEVSILSGQQPKHEPTQAAPEARQK